MLGAVMLSSGFSLVAKPHGMPEEHSVLPERAQRVPVRIPLEEMVEDFKDTGHFSCHDGGIVIVNSDDGVDQASCKSWMLQFSSQRKENNVKSEECAFENEGVTVAKGHNGVPGSSCKSQVIQPISKRKKRNTFVMQPGDRALRHVDAMRKGPVGEVNKLNLHSKQRLVQKVRQKVRRVGVGTDAVSKPANAQSYSDDDEPSAPAQVQDYIDEIEMSFS